MLDIIFGYIWHYLLIIWPYFALIAPAALSYIIVFRLGRWIEHRKWRREVKNGNYLGELIQQQLQERDAKNRKLAKTLKYREDQAERLGEKHRRILGLCQEMLNVAISEDIEALRGRKRA